MRGPIDLAGAPAADVAHEELQGAADRGVGSVALTESVDAGVHPDPARAGTAAHDHRADGHRGGEQPVHVELVGAHRLHRGEHPREVLGETARHHGSDGDLLDGDVDEIGRDGRDDLVERSRRASEHAQHALLGRRHDGEAVGPPALEHQLELVLELGDLDAARAQDRGTEPHP